jgi:hypothetical protein
VEHVRPRARLDSALDAQELVMQEELRAREKVLARLAPDAVRQPLGLARVHAHRNGSGPR